MEEYQMSNNGELNPCKKAGCDWKCCNFGSEGHIILLPNEYESAIEKKEHLKVIDDNYMGGKKIKCTAKDRANCDDGYKPIQCKVYPLWIDGKNTAKRSLKCPLDNKDVKEHINTSISIVNDFKAKNKEIDIDRFLKNAEVDKYGEI